MTKCFLIIFVVLSADWYTKKLLFNRLILSTKKVEKWNNVFGDLSALRTKTPL